MEQARNKVLALFNNLSAGISHAQNHPVYTPLFVIAMEGARAARNEVQLLSILCHTGDLLKELFQSFEVAIVEFRAYYLSEITRLSGEMAADIQEESERAG
jgi:hypothetical protein